MQDFPTLEAYEANISSKISRLVEIIQHHIGEQNNFAPPLFWDRQGNRTAPPPGTDLTPDIEASEAVSNDTATQPSLLPDKDILLQNPQRHRKIVVYCHLKFGWSLIAHVSVAKVLSRYTSVEPTSLTRSSNCTGLPTPR